MKLSDVFPGKSWIHVIPQLKPVKGVGGVSAKDCGKCHTEIYKEWKTSTHSQALHDLQFQSELAKDSSPAWICLNCHIPIQNQRESIIIGLENGDYRKPVTVPNPGFDPNMREEGVTCATCHVKQDKDGESYILGSNGNTDPPHPVKIDKTALRNRCQDCHNVEYALNEDLVCYFQTGEEMKASQEMPSSQKYCSNCHLPEISRSFVKPELEKPVRVGHKHNFWGGGIPKKFEFYKNLPKSGFRSALNTKLTKIFKDETTGKWIISLEIKNDNPGHKLPTGDPERHIVFEVTYINSSGKILNRENYKIGQNWEWWPKAKLLNDNRLFPNESRKIDIQLSNQLDEKDFLEGKIRIEATHIRLTEENAEFMKKRYKQASPSYSGKIQDLEKHYPYKTKIFFLEKDLKTNRVVTKNWKELLKKE